MNSLNERIREFNAVRDIPYGIALKDEQDYTCLTKCRLLKLVLKGLSIKSRPIICEFSWQDLGVPPSILKHEHPEPSTHVYLEVQIPESGDWVVLDPTWDSRLKHKKIAIAHWNGKSATEIAVKPTLVYSPKKSLDYLLACEKIDAKAYKARFGRFYRELNRWLGTLRS